MNDNLERSIAQVLRTAQPTPLQQPGCLEQISRGVAQKRSKRVFPRRRWVLATMGAAVVLFALGFVPFPAGSAKGALTRAMAAIQGATGIYIRYHSVRGGIDRIHETWTTTDGMRREELRDDGRLQEIIVYGKDSRTIYNPAGHTAQIDDFPPGDGPAFSDPTLGELQKQAEAYLQQGKGDVNEWRERSLWGGESDFVEVTLEPAEQGKIKIIWEIDAATGRLISERMWEFADDQWQLVGYTEEVTWDLQMPSDTFTFVPPQGTKVTSYRWWRDRFGATVATGQTPDWQVLMHAVDVGKDGDLVLTLSRRPSQGGQTEQWDAKIPVEIDAIDNLGVGYHLGEGYDFPNYLAVTVHRDASDTPPGTAQTVTVTIRLRPSGPGVEQMVTFPALPLPPMREDLGQPEVVQY